MLTEYQKRELPRRKQEATNNLPEAVVGAYNLLVAVDEDGEVRVQTLRHGEGSAFERIKATLLEEERIILTTLDPELLLPGSYLDLWRPDEESKRVETLIQAFGQFARLPRLLRPEALYDSLRRGVREGLLVLRIVRGDGSVRTFWRIPPDEETLKRPDLEVQPAAKATLHTLDADLLKPGVYDAFWPTPQGPVSLGTWRAVFDGRQTPRLASPEVLDKAVREAVRRGLLMARVGEATYFREPLPEGPLPDGLELLPPPEPLRGADLTPQALPEAWEDGKATLRALVDALAARRGYRLPWTLIQEAIDEALRLRLFERTADSGPWPCSPAAADDVVFQVTEQVHLTPEVVAAGLSYAIGSFPTLREIKDAVEARILGRSVSDVEFLAAARDAVSRGLMQTEETGPLALTTHVRRPAQVLVAEATLGPADLPALAEAAERLLSIAPEMDFTFRIVLSAEGEQPNEETLERLNSVLEEVKSGWRLEGT